MRLHRRGGRDGGGCELGIAASHLHKGQGSMPNGGKGWHYAFQTGREGSLERERQRVGVAAGRGSGGGGGYSQ